MLDCGIGRGYSLVVDPTHAYWIDAQANAIFRKRL
jgi:hypothetical protein